MLIIIETMMKAIKILPSERIESFGFEVLDNKSMNELRGGGKPITRDRDVFDLEEE